MGLGLIPTSFQSKNRLGKIRTKQSGERKTRAKGGVPRGFIPLTLHLQHHHHRFHRLAEGQEGGYCEVEYKPEIYWLLSLNMAILLWPLGGICRCNQPRKKARGVNHPSQSWKKDMWPQIRRGLSGLCALPSFLLPSGELAPDL